MLASINSAQRPSCSYDKAFGLRLLCPPHCINPMVQPFFSRSFTNLSAMRDSRKLLTVLFTIFYTFDFTGIADIPCRRSPIDMSFNRVILSSAFVGSSVFATTTEFFRFFVSPPVFSVCSNAHLLKSLQPLFDETNTQVGASNHQHSLFGQSPPFFLGRSMSAGLPFLRDFSCRCPSFHGIPSWRSGRSQTLTFSFGSSSLPWIVFHLT